MLRDAYTRDPVSASKACPLAASIYLGEIAMRIKSMRLRQCVFLCLLAAISCDIIRDPNGYKNIDCNTTAEKRAACIKIAKALYEKGSRLRGDGDYRQSDIYLHDSINVYISIAGRDNPDQINSLIELASLYIDTENPIYAKAVAGRVAELIKRHARDRNYVTAATQLGRVYQELGLDERAEPVFRDAHKAAMDVFGKKSSWALVTEGDLAILGCNQGHCENIENTLRRIVRAISFFDNDHISDLRRMYRFLGIHMRSSGRAVEFASFLQTLENEMYPRYDCILADMELELIRAYIANNDNESADKLYRKIASRLSGSDDDIEMKTSERHRDDAVTSERRVMMGNIEYVIKIPVIGDPEWLGGKGIPGWQRNSAKILCYNNSTLMRLTAIQGNLLENKGALNAAAVAYRAAINPVLSRGYSNGERYRYVDTLVDTVMRYSGVLARLNRMDDAQKILYEAINMYEHEIRSRGLWRSETYFFDYMSQMAMQDSYIMTLLHESHMNPQLMPAALTAHILHNSRDIDESAQRFRLLNQVRLSEQMGNMFENYQVLTARYAKASQRRQQQQADAILSQLKDLEETLLVGAASSRRNQLPPDSKDLLPVLAKHLGENSGLLLYSRYLHRPLSVQSKKQGDHAEQWRYMAFVFKSEKRVIAFDLGPAEAIDSAVKSLYESMSNPRSSNYKERGEALYRLVMGPLRTHLDGLRQLLIVPDGNLNLVPFFYLPEGEHLLGERLNGGYLTSALDLLPRPEAPIRTSDVVVYADPDLHAAVSLPRPEGGSRVLQAPIALTRGTRNNDTCEFGELPGTREEAMSIRASFPQALVLTGMEASESHLRTLPRPPAILHFATHGQFFSGLPSLQEGFRPRGIRLSTTPDIPHDPQNPLLQSMIALAGACRLDTNNPESADDGWATALELSSLPLIGTQMVVLSACKTGQGVLLPGHGVVGLRRAFMVAGAETVVASLWPVHDTATRDLMRAYYRRLRQGDGRAAAMQRAVQELRAKYPHPYYWAAFIVIGDGSPLRGVIP